MLAFLSITYTSIILDFWLCLSHCQFIRHTHLSNNTETLGKTMKNQVLLLVFMIVRILKDVKRCEVNVRHRFLIILDNKKDVLGRLFLECGGE